MKKTAPAPPPGTFGQRLKAARKRAGLTQEKAAAVLEIPSRTYWQWENDSGKSAPPPITQEGALARLERSEA
jgi:transcriptional regulator with XRE-family HTH domain